MTSILHVENLRTRLDIDNLCNTSENVTSLSELVIFIQPSFETKYLAELSKISWSIKH